MATTAETRITEVQGDDRGNLFLSEKYTTIKVTKTIAHMVRIYCLMNHVGVSEFVIKLLDKELVDFKKRFEEMKKLK